MSARDRPIVFMAALIPPTVTTYTLNEFGKKYLAMEAAHDGSPADIEKQHARAAQFAVCGFETEENAQANINCLDRPFDMADSATQVRDYDSLLGFVDAPIMVVSDVYIHPIPNPEHTLKKSIYVKVPFILPGHVSFLLFSLVRISHLLEHAHPTISISLSPHPCQPSCATVHHAPHSFLPPSPARRRAHGLRSAPTWLHHACT